MNKKEIMTCALAAVIIPLSAPLAFGDDELPPCEYEDSTNCHWDASERGNGEGDSFTDIDGEAIYDDEEVNDMKDWNEQIEAEERAMREYREAHAAPTLAPTAPSAVIVYRQPALPSTGN